MSTNDKVGEHWVPCIFCKGVGSLYVSAETAALAEKAVEAQRNDKRTPEERIRDGVKFIMGPDEQPSSDVATLGRDQIIERVEAYFKRVEKLGGDTGECSAAGIADFMLWQSDTENFAANVSLQSASSATMPAKPPCGWLPWGTLVNEWLKDNGDLANMRAADLWDRIVQMSNEYVGAKS